jgi:hypothetical protein
MPDDPRAAIDTRLGVLTGLVAVCVALQFLMLGMLWMLFCADSG